MAEVDSKRMLLCQRTNHKSANCPSYSCYTKLPTYFPNKVNVSIWVRPILLFYSHFSLITKTIQKTENFVCIILITFASKFLFLC